jgi:methylenetetrahydrofolate dehydrogenase (NADP+)/methenyltetrahydrofolate cyclohydrolase
MRTSLAECRLVVVSAAHPGIVSAGWLAPDAVAIDAGYFNEGGVGDIDVSDGFGHLRALAPVPGGIGPMTISMLIERVIERAEADLT